MVLYRICKECNGKEADGIIFPNQGEICNTCKTAKRNQENKEKRRKYDKVYQERHKEHIAEHKKQYYQDNKERIAARHAKYHQKHKEQINAKDRQEYAEKTKDRPARPCIDCGAPMPKRARMYCKDCKEKHKQENVRKAIKRYRKKDSE